jgi:hypothetical protein
MWILAQTVFLQLIALQRFSDEFRWEQAEKLEEPNSGFSRFPK